MTELLSTHRNHVCPQPKTFDYKQVSSLDVELCDSSVLREGKKLKGFSDGVITSDLSRPGRQPVCHQLH